MSSIQCTSLFFNGVKSWIIKIPNEPMNTITLLLSKVSEALTPNQPLNHIGDGGTIDQIISIQKGVRFIINGGFNHYRKKFYKWNHDNYNIGDPVGKVKIRNHLYQDIYDHEKDYGFFCQSDKQCKWEINQNFNSSYKYVLGCTPLLIYEGIAKNINYKNQPSLQSEICPPSYLGHALENHPRTAVGLKDDFIYFIVIEQSGLTLPELQELGLNLKLDSLLNLDGGGSSQFRLRMDDNTWIGNSVESEDKDRVLGNVIILFDETLK